MVEQLGMPGPKVGEINTVSNFCQKLFFRGLEMAQRLRAFDALAKGISSVPAPTVINSQLAARPAVVCTCT